MHCTYIPSITKYHRGQPTLYANGFDRKFKITISRNCEYLLLLVIKAGIIEGSMSRGPYPNVVGR